MKDYTKLTKAELIRRIAALEKVAPGPSMAFAHERLLHDLQVHQVELETQNRELREAQHLVELSRDRYADLFDFAPVGYVTLDENGVIREVNLTAAGMLGVARTRLVGTPFHLHVAREDLAGFRAHLRTLTEPDQRTSAELLLLRKGRAPVPVLMQSMLVAHAETEEKLCRTAITDITARKQAEQELADERNLLRTLIDSMPDVIFTKNLQGQYGISNPAHVRFAGAATESELVGKTGFDIFPAELAEVYQRDDIAVFTSGQRILNREEPSVKLNGTDRWLITTKIPLHNQAGEVVGLVGVSRDITERRQAEAALRESEERLQTVVENLAEGLVISDLEGRLVSWNRASLEMHGFASAAEARNRLPELSEIFEISTPGGSLLSVDQWPISRVMRGEVLRDLELRVRRLDTGVERIFSYGGSTVRDNSGRPLAFVTITDITERKRVEEALEKRTRQQQAVAELGQHAVAGRDLARLIQDAVALVPLVLGVEFCKLLELRRESGDLLVRAGTGWKRNVVGRATVSAGRESQAGFTLIGNAPVTVEDYAQETRFPMPPLLAKHGVRSGVSGVIHTRGVAFGVLAVHSTRPRKFSGDDVHFVQSVANILAVAIDRRDLEEELLKISDNERARIGQDLHDDLCQQLTGIELRAEVLRLRLAGLPEAQEEVEKIGGYLRVATLRARTLAHGLSPVQLEANGLMAALHELTADMGELFRVTCLFRCESPVLITDQFAATHLYRIAQEAISNAVRHGHARDIVVSLAPSPAGGVLTVTDDGVGCAMAASGSTGMGLRTMRYRSEMIGATLRIEPGDGGSGTTVRCEFQPLSK